MLNVYALKDLKLDQFTTPFFAPSEKHAVRILVNSFGAESQLCLYPSDYELWQLASWDEVTGVFSNLESSY